MKLAANNDLGSSINMLGPAQGFALIIVFYYLILILEKDFQLIRFIWVNIIH